MTNTSGNAQTDRIIADLIAEGKVFRCPDCQRLYGSAEWLQQHRDKCHKDQLERKSDEQDQ